MLNGLAKVISTLFLEAVGGNLYLRTASDKSVLGQTATQFRDELNVYTKAQWTACWPEKITRGTRTGSASTRGPLATRRMNTSCKVRREANNSRSLLFR